ncbi:hypothetical protein [Thiolapillus sp.]
MKTTIALVAFILVTGAVLAGEADVIDAKIIDNGSAGWTFHVTLKHADEGWKHYADRWEVLSEGKVLATRILAHPHVNEQPFTRSLSGVQIPESTQSITIRAHDKLHGYGGATLTFDWPPGQ